MSTLPKFHTAAEVAEALKTSTWWVRQQVKAGRVQPVRLSESVNAPLRFSDEDVAQLLATLRPPAPASPKRRRRRT